MQMHRLCFQSGGSGNMALPDKTLTLVVRAGLEKACKEFTARIEPLGFRRTLKMIWTRRHPLTVDFIHFHRHGSTYGTPRNAEVNIRVHFGIRVLNDAFMAAALNGPLSDPGRLRAGGYHLRFNAASGSMYDRCVDDLVRFVVEQGEAWFQTCATIEAILNRADSPLKPDAKLLLQAAQMGQTDPTRLAASLKLLGIKEK
jgi:hypothetical protein